MMDWMLETVEYAEGRGLVMRWWHPRAVIFRVLVDAFREAAEAAIRATVATLDFTAALEECQRRWSAETDDWWEGW